MVNHLTAAVGMGIYVMAVLYATKIPYTMMVERGMEHIRAVYYNRKIVHMLAGGVGSLSVPFLFTDVWYPMVSGILLTALLYASHRAGIVMHWFQTEQNQNDVKFGLMWWMSISLIWWLVGDPWLAIVPSLFMAFGDGVTGVVERGGPQAVEKPHWQRVHVFGQCTAWLVCRRRWRSEPSGVGTHRCDGCDVR